MNKGIKNDWLREVSIVYDPLIDYKADKIFSKLIDEIAYFKPDLIVGSSMGGYVAYLIANELQINAVLFNPALHSRSFEPDTLELTNKLTYPEITIVLGVNDQVIKSELTKTMFSRRANITIIEYSHGHRTPFDVFKTEIEKHIHR